MHLQDPLCGLGISRLGQFRARQARGQHLDLAEVEIARDHPLETRKPGRLDETGDLAVPRGLGAR